MPQFPTRLTPEERAERIKQKPTRHIRAERELILEFEHLTDPRKDHVTGRVHAVITDENGQ